MTPLEFMALFEEFQVASWDGWRAVLGHLTPATRELFVIAGRGAGKSRLCALLACCFASREYRRAPGERIYVGVFGPDRRQARLTFSYIVGLLRSVPELAALVEREARESLDLKNGVTVEVITAGRAAPRGRSYALAIVEEAAFLPQDDAADPDRELVRAVRPALARVPGSLLAVVSSPYARRGVLFEAWKRNTRHVYRDGMEEVVVPVEGAGARDVVVVEADTLSLNPTFDARAIEKARGEDPVSAATEYDAQFRSDVESFVSREVVTGAVVPGRVELPPVNGVAYGAFCDPAGGSGADSMTLAIGHREGRVIVVDAVREVRPHFSPEQAVADFAGLLLRYDVKRVIGDRYAGSWPSEAFARHRVEYEAAARPKSDLYRDSLPLLNSGQLELLDHARLVAQVVGLERRTARGGRDSIDHAPAGHDDIANAVLGLAATIGVEDTMPRFEMLW